VVPVRVDRRLCFDDRVKSRQPKEEDGSMKKRCQECKRVRDSSSFNGSSREPDGMAKKCSACVNRRRRELHAAKSKTGNGKPADLGTLVKKGDYLAVKKNRTSITSANRDRLLALAVTDFKSAPKKPGHLELVKLLIEMGAKPDFHLVCAATVGPHVDIMNALIEAGAERNIFTAAALGDVDRVRDLLVMDSTLGGKTTHHENMTALDYACRSELGKVNRVYADRLAHCARLLLDQSSTPVAESDHGETPLGLCASRGGNVKIAQLLLARGWRPSVSTVLGALGHFQRHGRGNYGVAALCVESGVDINEFIGSRTLLHAFAHQGDLIGTRWLVAHGAKINVRDHGNNTPLHKACERNSTLKVVELLVEHGASLTAVNNNGERALDVAIRNDKKGIVAFLRRIGAKAAVFAE
jgi:ankyrin repeat protein